MNLNQPWSKVSWVGLLSHHPGFSYFLSVCQGIVAWGFQMHLLWIFVCLFFLFGFLYFLFFLRWCVLDFSLMLASFCFRKYTYLHHWAIQTKTIENFFPEITSESLYKHQWYIAEIDIYVGKILLFERSYWFQSLSKVCHDHLLSFYAVPFP